MIPEAGACQIPALIHRPDQLILHLAQLIHIIPRAHLTILILVAEQERWIFFTIRPVEQVQLQLLLISGIRNTGRGQPRILRLIRLIRLPVVNPATVRGRNRFLPAIVLKVSTG